MQSLFRAEFSEDEAQALREASTFARWIDRTYRPQLGKLTQGLLGELGEAGLQQALQQAALRHLTSPTSTTGLQACVQAQPSILLASKQSR